MSHGAIHSRSKMWSLWHGSRTTSGNLSTACCEMLDIRAFCSAPRINLPSKNGLPQMGQESVCLRDFFGTRSSSGCSQLTGSVVLCKGSNQAIHIPSRKASLTPCTSLGGLSASASRLWIKESSKAPPPSCLIVRKASDRVVKTARTSAGIGVALLFWVVEVLTSSRLEKKVERSGRTGW